MHLGKIAFAVTLSAALNAAAMNNGVMVDLSVLDNLSSSYESTEQPLFPIVSKEKSVEAHPVKKVKKSVNSVKINKTETLNQNEEDELNKKERLRKHLRENRRNRIARRQRQHLRKMEEPEVKVVDVEPVENPVVVVDVEPVVPTVQENKEEKPSGVEIEAKKEVFAPAVIENKQENITEQVPVQKNEEAKEIVKVVENPQEDNTLTNQAQVISDEHKMTDVLEAPKIEMPIAENIEPVVDVKSNQLKFSEDQDELDPLLMAKLDNIVGHFKNEPGNKILIFSYNVGDVEGAFRKKRISLNRAIEVRSYLIKQGFKNFSIKIVNISSDSDKINTIELEEI